MRRSPGDVEPEALGATECSDTAPYSATTAPPDWARPSKTARRLISELSDVPRWSAGHVLVRYVFLDRGGFNSAFKGAS
jgi:hypothetical protein